MNWVKIEEVAKQCGLTKRTIRYYEEIGILSPPKRTEKGIRLYTQEQIEEIKKILNTKEVLGFSLKELQHLISISDELENYRQDYKSITDLNERREKLLEIDQIVEVHLELIEQKVRKFLDYRTELENIRFRARKAIAEINENKMNKE